MWPFKKKRDPRPTWMLDDEFMAWLRQDEPCDHGAVKAVEVDAWREGISPWAPVSRAICRCEWREAGWDMAAAALRNGFAEPRDFWPAWFDDTAFLDYAGIDRGPSVARAARHRYDPSFEEAAEKLRHIHKGWVGRMRTTVREKAS